MHTSEGSFQGVRSLWLIASMDVDVPTSIKEIGLPTRMPVVETLLGALPRTRVRHGAEQTFSCDALTRL